MLTEAKVALGVTVPYRRVEEVLKLLRKLQIVDRDLRFKRTGGAVAIPLSRELTGNDRRLIESSLGPLKVESLSFLKADGKPRNLEDTLGDLLPPDKIRMLPRSFDMVGDIVLVRLPHELEGFGAEIGAGILKVNPHVRLVLRRSSKISGPFRTGRSDILAGVGPTETLHKEFSCRYFLDVNAVYFNPRLSGERLRVARQVHGGETVIDMFAGVGPYSILIAELQPYAKVYAIELNPQGFDYLKRNVSMNKVSDRVVPLQGDAKKIVESKLAGLASRVIMNLPSDAETFLGSALQALRGEGGIIHFYAFTRRDESLETVKEHVREIVEKMGRRIVEFGYGKVMKEITSRRVEVALDIMVA